MTAEGSTGHRRRGARPRRRGPAGAIAVGLAAGALALLTACTAAEPALPGQTAADLAGPGGTTQHVVCAGSGSPAVVLVHGIGDDASSANLVEVQRRLAADHRTCRHDRPGTGRSPAPPEPSRDGADLAAELGVVMDHADPDSPVVLVGHSFGSYPVILAVGADPDRVHGVVLVDAVDPGDGLLPALGLESWAEVDMAAEALDLPAVEEAVRSAAAPGVGDMPWVVVHRSEGLTASWVDAQERLGALSSTGTVRVARASGHDIPVDDPAGVVDAVLQVADP